MAGGGVERSMEGYDIGLAGYRREVAESFGAFAHGARRVVDENTQPHCPAPALDDRADMAAADDSERLRVGTHGGEGGEHPLRHGRSVAAGRRRHCYSAPSAIVEIDMVGADGGGGYEAHRGAVEQRGVAACACPDYQPFGIACSITGDSPGGQKNRFYGELRQKRGYMRNLVFDN